MSLTVLGLAIFGAAQTTGAGWLVVLASLVVGTVVTGAIWPLWQIRSVTVAATGPIDVVAGRPFQMAVSLDGTRTGIRVEISRLTDGPSWTIPPATGTVEVTVPQRGIRHDMVAEVTCSAPFDLFTARRRISAKLPHPIYVAPRPISMPLPDRLLGGSSGEGTGTGGTGPGDMVRSLREYVPGDAMRMVHWRASAGRMDLVVKELEPPERPRLALIVDVSGVDAEQIAGEAAGLIQSARREGLPVTLMTYEAAGAVRGDVGSSREAGRRLAGAIPGKPPVGPLPEGTKVIRVGSGKLGSP